MLDHPELYPGIRHLAGVFPRIPEQVLESDLQQLRVMNYEISYFCIVLYGSYKGLEFWKKY